MIRTLSGAVDRDLADDVAIVGAGPAGISLALELASSSLRIALFEGGSRQHSDASQTRYEGETTTSEGFAYPPLDVLRLRQFGGTSNHWSGWCRPIEPEVFGERPWLGTEPWPLSYDDLAEGYRRAHHYCELGDPEYDARILCRAAGLPLPMEPTDLMSTPVWWISPPTRFGDRYEDELAASTIDVFLEANCVGIDVVDGVARAVRLVSEDGSTHRAESGHVVLACGGIETSRTLLHLAEDVPEVNRSGLVGVGFLEHSHVVVGAVLARRRQIENEGARYASMVGFGDADGTRFKVGLAVQPEASEERGMANLSFTFREPKARFAAEELAHGPSVTALETARADREVVPVPLLARSEHRFNVSSRVQLVGGTDDLGIRRARLDWRVVDEDRADVTLALGIVGREIQSQGLGPVVAGPRREGPDDVRGGGHQLGGARSNDDPDLGVVDRDLRCHPVPNLLVCGGAVFPAAGFSNPTLTIVALAVRMADLIRSEA